MTASKARWGALLDRADLCEYLHIPAAPNEMVACAAHLFDTTPADIWQKARFRYIVRIRYAVWWALYLRWGSFNRVAKTFGVDRTTVQYGVRKACAFADESYDYADKVATLVALCDGEFLAYKRRLQRERQDVTRGLRRRDLQDL